MKINTAFHRWLFCCFLFIGAMIIARFAYTGKPYFLFLVWNLFLAWVPYVFSTFFEEVSKKAVWKQSILFISWLLFFPNALYIVTDIIHLQDTGVVPLWFDAALLFSASFAGLALAFSSLLNAEQFLRKYFSKRNVALLIILLLFTGAFGVYLGRFQRWNSWDVVSDLPALASDVSHRIINPAAHFKSWIIVFFLTALYGVCWYFLKVFQGMKGGDLKIK
jgi:uncharacterized membrane protein